MKEDKKVSWEDIAWSNMYSIEALMNILQKKGVITKTGSNRRTAEIKN